MKGAAIAIVLVVAAFVGWSIVAAPDGVTPEEARTDAAAGQAYAREIAADAFVYDYVGVGALSANRGPTPENADGRDSIPALDAIRPVYNPDFIDARKSLLLPGDFVIGLSLNGDSRAYPIAILERREMVNDVVGGIPVLVAW
jgi:hypothetical protein